MRERAAATIVHMTDHEGRRGHRTFDAEAAQRAAHERRLPGAEFTGDQDDVPWLQARRELRPGSFGALRPVSHEGAHGA